MSMSVRHRKGHIDVTTRNARIIKQLALCMCAVALFCAGFVVRGNHDLMSRLGIEEPETKAAVQAASADSGEVASRLNEVEGILAKSSLDSYDTDACTSAVLDSFLQSTNDTFTRYYSADRYSTYVDVTASEDYPGVGVFFSEYNGQAYALDVFEGSSASDAGVLPGDFVVAIDGDRSQEWTSTEVINAVQREAGSTVVITWRRPTSLDASGGDEFTTTLVCTDYTEPNVTAQLQNNVGYIKLRQFTQNADSLVRQAIEELSSQGAQSFVLDLRDNPGGYLNKAVDVASLFVKSGVVVEIDTVDAQTTKQVSGDVATDAPVVVLVNGNTAGSAEVLAAALRDSNRATLVGVNTMGRGSVQVTKPLSFGGALRYTAARYKSPSGYTIDGVGVSPDVVISLREGSSVDNQKEIAIETAGSLVVD